MPAIAASQGFSLPQKERARGNVVKTATLHRRHANGSVKPRPAPLVGAGVHHVLGVQACRTKDTGLRDENLPSPPCVPTLRTIRRCLSWRNGKHDGGGHKHRSQSARESFENAGDCSTAPGALRSPPPASALFFDLRPTSQRYPRLLLFATCIARLARLISLVHIDCLHDGCKQLSVPSRVDVHPRFS